MIGNCQQGKELCALAGVLPEAVQYLDIWTAKLQERTRAVELQVEQHILTPTYSDLAVDFHFLGNFREFNSSFLLSGKDEFNVIANRVAAMTRGITDKLKYDWQHIHGQFLEMMKTVGPQLDAAALGNLKTNMVGLIEKLKVLTSYILQFL